MQNNLPNKLTLLIVEDDPIQLDLLKMLLGKHFNTIGANNAEDGINLIRSEKPDAVISDTDMPGRLNGFHVMEAANDSGTPALMVSGMPIACRTPEQRAKIKPQQFMEKPYSVTDLLTRLLGLMHAKQCQPAVTD